MSRQSRHLSAILEQAVHLAAATQGTRTNPDEAGCRFEQNVECSSPVESCVEALDNPCAEALASVA